MQHIIEGGASDKVHEKKKQIIDSMSQSDKEFMHQYTKSLKDSNHTKFGESKGGFYRRVAVIPHDIMKAIEAVDPDVFKDKKKLERFLNQFPMFKGADKV